MDAHWQRACSGTGTESKSAVTAITVETTFIWLGMFINAGWTRADYFYSTDSQAWTWAGTQSGGNMPAHSELVGMNCGISKTVGTTARTLAVDLMGLRYDFTRG